MNSLTLEIYSEGIKFYNINYTKFIKLAAVLQVSTVGYAIMEKVQDLTPDSTLS